MHTRLGFPSSTWTADASPEQGKSNLPHGPEGTNLILAEGIKKEYALHSVFSQEVADAHIRGDIHLHGLGYVTGPTAPSSPSSSSKIRPLSSRFLFHLQAGEHAEVLLAHLVRWSASLQGYLPAPSVGRPSTCLSPPT